MSEHIQPLLERIQSEGLKKAESEREEILNQARTDAASIIEKATQEAEAIRAAAEADAEATQKRSLATLEQSARDVLLRLRTEMNHQLRVAAEKAASAPLSSADVVAGLIKELISSRKTSGTITVETHPGLGAELEALLPALLKDAGANDVRIVMNPKSGAGFQLRFSDSAEGIDVSAEAVAEWLGALVRPELTALLKSGASQTEASGV
jgi:vacuolar-type H+-ATPase subunit E/Vma4